MFDHSLKLLILVVVISLVIFRLLLQLFPSDQMRQRERKGEQKGEGCGGDV